MDEETKEVIEDDDIIMPDETEDMPTEETEGVEELTEQASEVETTPQTEDEGQKILEYLNKKGIKYNGETVELKDLDEVVNNIEKGMNYDKLKSKQDHENDVVLSFISEQAKKANLTSEQYIEQVKAFQAEQEKKALEESVQGMVERGIDPETARRVAEVEAYKKQLEQEKVELAKQREEIERKAKEDKEYEDFIKAYPDVKYSEIPGEVFKESKDIGLTNAYAKYENKLLKEKIKTLEQNKNNASNSVVTPTSNGSPTEQESKDAFLEGFDSED